jgi:hypothetical protein
VTAKKTPVFSAYFPHSFLFFIRGKGSKHNKKPTAIFKKISKISGKSKSGYTSANPAPSMAEITIFHHVIFVLQSKKERVKRVKSRQKFSIKTYSKYTVIKRPLSLYFKGFEGIITLNIQKIKTRFVKRTFLLSILLISYFAKTLTKQA